jgi:nicotinate-nucleotide--dimethylbenzimidazole phosphoribosyltransferase
MVSGPSARVETTEAGFTDQEIRGVYRLIERRRDVRHFRPDPVPDHQVARLLWAAHRAGSVGFMQPWSFVVVRDVARRRLLRDSAERQRLASAAAMGSDPERADAFQRLKVEGIMDCGVVLVVTVDPTRGGHHVLGRYSDLESDVHSTCCAIQNLWLAARAEGLGVGWVSFFHPGEVQAALGIPPHVRPLAILCVGRPAAFPTRPLLEIVGWERRRSLADVVHLETWGGRGLGGLHDVDDVEVAVPAPDEPAAREARDRQDRLTKPRGSLGALEELSIRLAAATGRRDPCVRTGVLFLPEDGGGPSRVCAVLARRFGVRTVLARSEGRGTTRALEAGRRLVLGELDRGLDVVVAGDAGPAGPPSPTALICACTGLDAADLSGATDRGIERLRAEVRDALDAHRGHFHEPLGALACLGDEAVAQLVGVIVEGAAQRLPVLIGGASSVAAALVATAIAPEAAGSLVAACASPEPGHEAALRLLGLRPLLNLDVRLGSGADAVVALPMLDAAVRLLNEMATFDEAGVSTGAGGGPR